MEIGEIGGQRRQPGFAQPAGARVDQKRGADFHDDAAEVGEGRNLHDQTEREVERWLDFALEHDLFRKPVSTFRDHALQLRFVLQLRLVLKAIIAGQAADQLAALPIVEDAADIFAGDAGHGGDVALTDLLADDNTA